MRFLVYLVTLLFVGMATAQNPTILQGNYITNVFGQANFVKNPNALINGGSATINPYVTPVNATVTRSTTTPLVATTEFLVTTSTATGYVDWDLRTFDGGMKNNNCEARFTYRGFSVGSTTAQILQGANVVAQLTLTASTDPRIASINFPCGDLSAVTKFRLQQATASLTGTNEIGGIYVGLATNMANVAQAEKAGSYIVDGAANCRWNRTGTTAIDNFSADSDCNTGTVTGAADTSAGKIPGAKFNNLKPGKYLVLAHFFATKQGTIQDSVSFRLTDGTNYSGRVNFNVGNASTGIDQMATLVMDIEYTTTTSPTFQVQGATFNSSNTVEIYNGGSDYKFQLSVYRFPSSSELVVTPERQNVFGAVTSTTGTASVAITSSSYTAFNSATVYSSMAYSGKATALTTGTCGTTNDAGLCIPTMPPGTYQVTVTTPMFTQNSAGTLCFFAISDGTTETTAGRSYQALANEENSLATLSGTFTYTSVQSNKAFRLVAKRLLGSGSCFNVINHTDGAKFTMIVKPLDQPSNSALYVQGPVLGAQTGAAIPASYVGEKISFTSRTISAVTTGWTANASALGTLTPGVWLVQTSLYCANVTSSTGCGAFIATGTNNAADQYLTSSNDTSFIYDANFGGVYQMISIVYAATASQAIYAKAIAYGANRNVTFYGYAIRLN